MSKESVRQLLENCEMVLQKTITKKPIQRLSRAKAIPTDYDNDLVEFMKKIYARLIVYLSEYRVHDEDGGCDVDCVGTQSTEEFTYKDNTIRLVYFPIINNDFGYCNEAMYYLNFPSNIDFSKDTIVKIRQEFEIIRNTLLENYNEIISLSGGRWFRNLKKPVNFRHLLNLQYDLYYKENEHQWKMKFTPFEQSDGPDGGRWRPFDIEKIYSTSITDTKEERYNEYIESLKYSGYKINS